jgi:hypothetical protein
MAENMVFMMVTAMLKNFYLYLVRRISEKVGPFKKDEQTESLHPAFCQRAGKIVLNGEAERSEPIYEQDVLRRDIP